MANNDDTNKNSLFAIVAAAMLGGLSPAVVSVGMYVELVRATERNATELLSSRRWMIEQDAIHKKHDIEIVNLRLKMAQVVRNN